MGDDMIGDSVDFRVGVTDPGDELGQGSQPGIAWKGLCHGCHDVGYCCADLPVLQKKQVHAIWAAFGDNSSYHDAQRRRTSCFFFALILSLACFDIQNSGNTKHITRQNSCHEDTAFGSVCPKKYSSMQSIAKAPHMHLSQS